MGGAYSSKTKILVLDIDTDAYTVTGSAAKSINDYVQTLDTSDQKIIAISSAIQGATLVVTIVSGA